VRWLADECVAAFLVASLRAAGHDVLYVAEAAAGLAASVERAVGRNSERIASSLAYAMEKGGIRSLFHFKR
jgi:hypothetical protein